MTSLYYQGRRIGYLDYRFVDEADWFTEQQDDLFDIPISTLKVLQDMASDFDKN